MNTGHRAHPVKDTATTARQLLKAVPVEGEHLNRCILGDDPERRAAEYLQSVYLAAHGEEIASLDSAAAAAGDKLALLKSDLRENQARAASVPAELPPDRNDPRPLMPPHVKAGISLMALAVPAIWCISVALVVSQLMEKYLHLATAPAMAFLVAASVSIAPSLGIEFFLQTWTKRDTAAAKRLLALTGAVAGICYIGIVSHMVKPELARTDPAAIMAELGTLDFPEETAPAPASSVPPAATAAPEISSSDLSAAAPLSLPAPPVPPPASADPAQWFLFCALLCEMCVAAGFLHGIVHLFKAHRPVHLKPHPVRVAASAERARLLREIDTVSSDAADIAGRRALHDHTCQLLLQEHTGRIRAARQIYESQRTLAGL